VFSGGYFFFPFSFFARTQIVSEWVLNPDRLTIAAGSTGWLFNVASDKCMGTDGNVAEKDAWQQFCQGDLTSQKWGVGSRVGFDPAQQSGWRRRLRYLEGRLTYYTRDDGLDAISTAFAFGWRF